MEKNPSHPYFRHIMIAESGCAKFTSLLSNMNITCFLLWPVLTEESVFVVLSQTCKDICRKHCIYYTYICIYITQITSLYHTGSEVRSVLYILQPMLQ